MSPKSPVQQLGNRLRALRKARNLSQYSFRKRIGLLQPYISRIENGRNTPSLETLEKWAHALEVPLYKLFCNGEQPPKLRKQTPKTPGTPIREPPLLGRFRSLLWSMRESDRWLLLKVAQKMARRSLAVRPKRRNSGNATTH